NIESKRPIGILTEADIVRVVADGQDVNDIRIRELMTSSPVVCDGATTIEVAAKSMTDGRFRHLPVVDQGGVVGIIDIGDVSRALLGPSAGSRQPGIEVRHRAGNARRGTAGAHSRPDVLGLIQLVRPVAPAERQGEPAPGRAGAVASAAGQYD